MNGWIYEEEAIDIIKYMYNAEDSETLCSKMQQHYTYSRQSSALQERYFYESEEHVSNLIGAVFEFILFGQFNEKEDFKRAILCYVTGEGQAEDRISCFLEGKSQNTFNKWNKRRGQIL